MPPLPVIVELMTVSRLAGLSLHGDSGELMAELDDSLEELEDGLDVLMILEKAYQKTMQDHIAVSQTTEMASTAAAAPRTCTPSQPQDAPQGSSPRRPLVEGSSTALVAVLDHSHTRAKRSRPLQLFGPTPRHTLVEPASAERGVTLTIAHLGDSMGMLVRGDEIVWRTEEMWWNVSNRLPPPIRVLTDHACSLIRPCSSARRPRRARAMRKCFACRCMRTTSSSSNISAPQ